MRSNSLLAHSCIIIISLQFEHFPRPAMGVEVIISDYI